MTTTATHPIVRGRTGPRALTTVGAAVAAPLLIWALADPLAGMDLRVDLGISTTSVGPISVILGALVAAGVALGLAAVLSRLLARPRPVFVTLAIVGLIGSLSGPVGAATTTSTALILVAMHVCVALVLILAGARRSRPRPVVGQG